MIKQTRVYAENEEEAKLIFLHNYEKFFTVARFHQMELINVEMGEKHEFIISYEPDKNYSKKYRKRRPKN